MKQCYSVDGFPPGFLNRSRLSPWLLRCQPWCGRHRLCFCRWFFLTTVWLDGLRMTLCVHWLSPVWCELCVLISCCSTVQTKNTIYKTNSVAKFAFHRFFFQPKGRRKMIMSVLLLDTNLKKLKGLKFYRCWIIYSIISAHNIYHRQFKKKWRKCRSNCSQHTKNLIYFNY